MKEIRETGEGFEMLLDRVLTAGVQANRANRWAIECGYIVRDVSFGDILSVKWTDWEALANGPPSEDNEDEERWSFEHEALTFLMGIGQEQIEVEAVGHVGGARLRLRLIVNGNELETNGPGSGPYRFVSGTQAVLSPVASRFAERLRSFASAGLHERSEQLALIGELKSLRNMIGRFAPLSDRIVVAIAPHLESFDVETPAKFAAKWTEEGNGRVSLQLFSDGQKEALPLEKLDDQGALLDLDSRKAVLLSAGARSVAAKARNLRRVRRDRVDSAVLRSPLTLLGDGVSAEGVDFTDYALEDFSHRVLGFEPAKRDSEASIHHSGTEWYDRDDTARGRSHLLATAPDGSSVELKLGASEELLALATRVERAASDPNTPIDIDGQQVLPRPELADRLRQLAQDPAVGTKDDAPSNPNDLRVKPFRPILADVSEVVEAPSLPLDDIEGQVSWNLLDRVLAPHVRLKAHQRLGIAWLWHRYVMGQPGALLADDMGLGKTLQIAAFLALAKARPRKRQSPRPTLIVAPVILIENWGDELKRFFVGEFPGTVLELHGDTIRLRRNKDGSLDRARIREYDIVMTNYETLARYATSLLAIDWDVVVLDEAHRIKNRGTSWSIAARGLSGLDDPSRPRKFEFGICATGTPVENRIHDLWALYDFLSPGSPFGSYDAFAEEYGTREDGPATIATKLGVGRTTSSLMRRTKAEALAYELPPKIYKPIKVEMTPFQRDQERVIVRRKGERGGIFGILQGLQKLYQHPWLLDENDPRDAGPEQAVEASPKLARCYRLLEEIRGRQEKALVFTLWTRMQWLLKEVFEQLLGVRNVRIINGDPKHRSKALQSIQEFSATDGFDVMVLSPLAAGVGLNIVAANHVIHYGRWWNPAKEDQATDRAYRIGQTRAVTVYYPVLHHPGNPDDGFDMKLDELVSRKRGMARALLDPVDSDDLTEGELAALEGA